MVCQKWKRYRAMLTEQQKELLITSERNKWAKRLREARNIFKKGESAIEDYFRGNDIGRCLIKKERVDLLYTYGGGIEFEKLKDLSEKHELERSNLETSTFLYVDEQEDEEARDAWGYGDCSAMEPVAILCYFRYSFQSLSDCKKLIKSLIKHTVSDAEFKFKMQPNGKDTIRYRKIIDETYSRYVDEGLNKE